MRVVMLLADNHEDSEVKQPFDTLRLAGHEVDLAGPQADKHYRGRRGLETLMSNLALVDVRPELYDLLLIPGGYSPDELRLMPAALNLCRAFFEDGRPVGAIGHGPQLLISAGLLLHRRLTCAPSIGVDLQNAGATWLQQPLVIDANLITARGVADLQIFCDTLLTVLKPIHSSV